MNCHRNLPSYGRWQKQFEKKGLVIIGVHTPEGKEERVPGNVARKVKELGIRYPVLLDPDGKTWRRWGQQYWPTVYLIDKQGRVRYRWVGELEYQEAGGEATMAELIESLLHEKQGVSR